MLNTTNALSAAGVFSTLITTGAFAQVSIEAEARTLQPGKTYQLVSRYSGQCLDVTDHSFNEGTQLQQWHCTGKPNQKFQVIANIKGAVQLLAEESKKYVKVANESLDNGGIIVQSSNNSGNSPRILLTPSAAGSYTVKFTNSGKCLDIDGPSTKAGTKIHQWDCHGGASQDWRLVEQTGGMGSKAWELTNTNLQIDSFQRLYRQECNANTIAAVDKSTGKNLWTYKSTGYDTPFVNCNDQGHVYVLGNGNLKALNPNDGKVLWTYSSNDEAGSLHCVEGYNSLFLVSSRNSDGVFRSIERETGRQRWSYNAKGFPSYVGKQGQNVLITVFEGSRMTLVNLESGTGSVKWTRDLREGEYVATLAKGDVIINRQGAIEKVNVDNGGTAWTYTGSSAQGDVYLEYNLAGILYARQGREIARLDSNSGSVQWSHTMPESVGTSNSTSLILKAGEVLVRTTDTASGDARMKLLDQSGKKLWENTTKTANSYAYQDNSGKVFVRGQRSISPLDLKTGETVWTFSREFPMDNESSFGTETFGSDVYVLYGVPSGRYPAMGIVRLDASSGAQQWDVWANETTTLIGADAQFVYTNRVMGSGIKAYKR